MTTMSTTQTQRTNHFSSPAPQKRSHSVLCKTRNYIILFQVLAFCGLCLRQKVRNVWIKKWNINLIFAPILCPIFGALNKFLYLCISLSLIQSQCQWTEGIANEWKSFWSQSILEIKANGRTHDWFNKAIAELMKSDLSFNWVSSGSTRRPWYWLNTCDVLFKWANHGLCGWKQSDVTPDLGWAQRLTKSEPPVLQRSIHWTLPRIGQKFALFSWETTESLIIRNSCIQLIFALITLSVTEINDNKREFATKMIVIWIESERQWAPALPNANRMWRPDKTCQTHHNRLSDDWLD